MVSILVWHVHLVDLMPMLHFGLLVRVRCVLHTPALGLFSFNITSVVYASNRSLGPAEVKRAPDSGWAFDCLLVRLPDYPLRPLLQATKHATSEQGGKPAGVRMHEPQR